MSFEQKKILAPRAAVLVESMRDVGYNLQSSVADVIDNSITAGASTIELFADTDSENPTIGILDDGCGMLENELSEAMRLGTRSPLEERSVSDLGRFGLGLKTASFSQCRRLLVLTRKRGKTSCAIWDLDSVAREDDWVVDFPHDFGDIPWADRLTSDGTLVVWQKLDRLIDERSEDDRKNMIRQIDETASHLELVFHRYLAGEKELKRVKMSLNGRPLEPFDPFHSRHPATIFGPEDVFRLGEREIRIQAVTLPHHKKVSAEDWKRYAGPEGYIKNQGFYLYRQKRLIIHGTWFNMAKQTELTKLARVRIDMPNGMDAEWKIDVKKASAQPPAPVRERLRRIIETIGAGSKKIYVSRGKRLIDDNRLPVWIRVQDKNRIHYCLNPEHPAFKSFSDELTDRQKREFLRLLDLVGSAMPIDTIFSDVSSTPESVSPQELDGEVFREIVKRSHRVLKDANYSEEDIQLMMSSAEPFKSRWEEAEEIISRGSIE